jgi:hypothetical protein
MSRFITPVALVMQLGYSAMLVVVGVAGIFTARWELATVFGIDPGSWSQDIQATMLNQYRFLKSLELGAGVFCFAYRADIAAGGRASRVFLAIVALGVIARSIAWFLDGRPATVFLIFLVLEALTFVAVALHLRLMDVSQ